MKKILLLLSLISAFFIANNAYASHIPGANITWTCNPNNPLEYTFMLTLLRTCPGTHPTTMPASYFSITNTCGLTNPIVPIFTQVGQAVDINQICSGQLSSCQGGPSTNPGVWMYTYQATITFPANCDAWNINFDLCCRDASTNTNGGTGNNVYVESLLNTTTAPCNNSSVITAQPIPYYCTGQTSTYCVTSTDVEGDSLYYVLVAPQGANGTPITQPVPYSISNPLQNSIFNPTTGCLTFNQPTTGNFVVTIQIQSYDALGNLTSYVNHDFQIIVAACTNSSPAPPTGFTNTSGSATINGSQISMCKGDNVCFDVTFSDNNINDSLHITTNGTTILPGATFTQTGSNPVTGTFCWVATDGYTSSIVNFISRDQFCPIVGQTSFSVSFNIRPEVYAGQDQTICAGNTYQLQVVNATNPVWTSIAGDTINVGTNISCDSCVNPVITPNQTTTYVVSSDSVSGICNFTDTVTITVLNAVGPQIPDTTVCSQDTLILDAGAGPYSSSWSTGDSTQTITIDTSMFGGNGTYNVSVTVTDNVTGCIYTDNTNVTFSICSGLDDNTSAIAFNIYPNPNKGQFTVSLITQNTSSLQIKVTNAQGQEIFVKNNFDNINIISENINIGEVKGIYFITIITNHEVITKKIIVQ